MRSKPGLWPLYRGFFVDINLFKASNERAAEIAKNKSTVVDDDGGTVASFGSQVQNLLLEANNGCLDYAARKYTLERMFANQLLECAKDQLSFRAVVRDLKLRSPWCIHLRGNFYP